MVSIIAKPLSIGYRLEWCLWYTTSKVFTVVGRQKQTRRLDSALVHGLGRGFALPTVLISSIVLMIVLTISVSATTAVRENLLNAYYDQLAQTAGDAGVAYAKACLAANNNVPQWSNAKPLTPTTDCAGNNLYAGTVQALVVAGGGGGANSGGGGGAGGYTYNSSFGLHTGNYTVTVGAGGAGLGGSSPGYGSNGGNSSILDSSNAGITTLGGGAGAPHGNSQGLTGGSGGGSGMTTSGTPVAGGNGTTGQGNNGGASFLDSGWNGDNGGGGGAGSPGAAGGQTAGTSGNGGTGLATDISGTMTYYAAGGGAGEINGSIVGTGGNGIGGSGQLNTVGTNAVANTGSGGGGGSYNGNYNGGGNGGSGIVIIKYPDNGTITATVTNGTTTTLNGYKIVTFTSSGSFNVTTLNPTSCPSDVRCALTVNGDVRSSFSVGLPTLDANGKAVTIPESGYVNLIRTSTGAVWKTIRQPAAQAAVVPDQCSGAATSGLGWNNAVLTTGSSFSTDPSASAISIANSAVNSGPVYYRKDFNVTQTGTYNISTLTQGNGYYFMDGKLISTDLVAGTVTNQVNITSAGCHTLTAEIDNPGLSPANSWFMLSLKPAGSGTSVVVSDTSWRVSAGNAYHYSALNYWEGSQWAPARVMGTWSNTGIPWGGGPAAWGSTTGDAYTQYIGNSYSASAYNSPPSAYTYLRGTQGFNLTSATTINIYYYCDDSCAIYMDGNLVDTQSSSGGVASTQIANVAPGWHDFGIRLYNAGSSGNPSAALFTATKASDGSVLMRSDASWDAAATWDASPTDYYSYDRFYTPNPLVAKAGTASVLVVGGGGSGGGSTGGGGGAGGVVYNASLPISAGYYPVTVGNGGAGVAQQTMGQNGGNSIFNGVIAFGGGAGGYSAGGPGPGGGGSSGGSGGGTETYYSTYVAGPGVSGQGFVGGTLYAGNGSTTGGGGAGGAGQNTSTTNGGGAGGVGVSNSITGSAVYYGGGGGGGAGSAGGAGGNGGGGNGASGTAGAAGGANTGGGGGGGWAYSGGSGGAGGSGVVIISFPTGAMSVSATGSYTTFTSGSNTIYKFTGNGTFIVYSINS